ncbi:hypothetical protein Y032_0015g2663 [Ancylostoma ceylanicum]|uniref:Uncharacterized protein n=1 Tax=Ancylostoma ceylanicum TaxID=53326 RepID=A0A016V8Y6_9BILA|nr:hypothetical protein Y032_0015g2663 [Ancylostoma ceylanicum]
MLTDKKTNQLPRKHIVCWHGEIPPRAARSRSVLCEAAERLPPSTPTVFMESYYTVFMTIQGIFHSCLVLSKCPTIPGTMFTNATTF